MASFLAKERFKELFFSREDSNNHWTGSAVSLTIMLMTSYMRSKGSHVLYATPVFVRHCTICSIQGVFWAVMLLLFCGISPIQAFQSNVEIWTPWSQPLTSYNIPAAATNIVRITASAYSILALRDDGKLVAWGHPQNASQTNVAWITKNVLSMDASVQFSVAACQDGSLLAWGDVQWSNFVRGVSMDIKDVYAGQSCILTLDKDGTPTIWNKYQSRLSSVPASVRSLIRASMPRSFVSSDYALGLRQDGQVVGWGYPLASALPVPSTATNVVAVAAGSKQAIALKGDGRLVVWGASFANQTNALTQASNIVAIACGEECSFALRNDGTVIAWGRMSVNKPLQPSFTNGIPYAITTGSDFVAALVSEGEPRFVDIMGDLTAFRGGDFHLNALAVGVPPLSYQWSHNGVPIEGANQPTLKLAQVDDTAAGEYSVVVANALGHAQAVVARVSVEDVPVKPVVVADPDPQTVEAGTSCVLQAVVTGQPKPSIQWQLNGTNIPGANDANYAIPYTMPSMEGGYCLIASNIWGVVTSAVATLTVVLPQRPVFTNLLTTVEAAWGAPFTLRAKTAQEDAQYYWYHDGELASDLSGPAISFDALTPSRTGTYQVVASNALGIAYSPVMQVASSPVIVWGKNTYGLLNPPLGLTNIVGIFAGNDNSYALKADGTVVGWGAGNSGMLKIPEEATNILTLSVGADHVLALRDDGRIIGWGTNKVRQINIPFAATNIIAVAAGDSFSLALKSDGTVLAWGTNNYKQTVVPKGATNIVAIAAGSSTCGAIRADGSLLMWGGSSQTPVPTNEVKALDMWYSSLIMGDAWEYMQWGYNLRSSIKYSVSTYVADIIRNLAAVSSHTSWHSVALFKNGTVADLFNQSYPSSTGFDLDCPSWCTNIVAVAGGGKGHMALARPANGLPVQLRSQRWAYAGQNVAFSATIPGQRLAQYQWLFNGQPLPQATGPYMLLKEVTMDAAGDYHVVVTDSYGSVTSRVSRLTVAMPPVPQITKQPISLSIGSANTAMFSVAVADGIPAQYQWQFNGADIAGAVESTLAITNIQSWHAGEYQVVITNWSGMIQSVAASLVVTASPPVIVLQPMSQSAMREYPILLSAQAVGSEPLDYHWLKDGIELPNANAPTLAITSMTESQAGRYRLVVSNEFGTASSAEITLTVNDLMISGDLSAGQAQMPAGLTNVISLAAGGGHVLALRNDGQVLAWGSNSCNQASAPSMASNVVKIAAGELFSLALRSDGSVMGFGSSYLNDTNLLAGLSNVVDITAGVLHWAALHSDGRVSIYAKYNQNNEFAVPVGLIDVTALAAGAFHTLALKADGTVVSWGLSTLVPESATNVAAIAAGYDFSAALRKDGTIVAWGTMNASNSVTTQIYCSGYSLGNLPAIATSLLPTPPEATNVVAIAAGRHHLLALRADGQVIAWGDNSRGQLNIASASNAVAIAAGGFQSVALTGSRAPGMGITSGSPSVGSGMPVLLQACAGGLAPLQWQWQFQGKDLEGQTNRSLWLSTPKALDSGVYQVLAMNSYGIATGTVSLAVTAAPPSFLIQPTNMIAYVGDAARLTCQAMGSEPLSYEWQKNAIRLSASDRITGVDSPQLIIRSVTNTDAGAYRVVARNLSGTCVSSNMTLVALWRPALEEAADLAGLEWRTGGTSDWHFQTTNTHDNNDALQSGPFSPGYATNWLETTITGPAVIGWWWSMSGWGVDHTLFSLDGQQYYDVRPELAWTKQTIEIGPGPHVLRWTHQSQNPFNNYISASYVDQLHYAESIAPVITTHPTAKFALVGTDISFTVAATGTLPLKYQWYSNGQPLDAETSSASITLSNIQPSMAGDYWVVVSNQGGAVTSSVAPLTLAGNLPVIKYAQSAARAVQGATTTLKAQVLGSQPMAFQWLFNGEPIINANGSSLVIEDVHLENSGFYQLVARNSEGTTLGAQIPFSVINVIVWGNEKKYLYSLSPILPVAKSLAFTATDAIVVSQDGMMSCGNSALPTPSWSALMETNLAILAARQYQFIGLRSDGSAFFQSYSKSAVEEAGLTNVAAVACGFRHFLALKQDGSVAAWGTDTCGQATTPPEASNVVAIAAGANFNLALREDGRIIGWGDNTCGQLDLPEGLTNVIAIAAGDNHSLALREDGTVAAWGLNTNGQCNVPEGLSNVVALAAGAMYSIALREDGSVVAWGGSLSDPTNTPPYVRNVRSIAAGYQAVGAVLGDGKPEFALQPLIRTYSDGTTRLQARAVGEGALTYQWFRNGLAIPEATSGMLDVPAGQGGAYQVSATNNLGAAWSRVVSMPMAAPVLLARRDGNGGFTIQLTGNPGQRYTLLSSTNLLEWTPIAEVTNVTGVVEWTDPRGFEAEAMYIQAKQTEP